MSKKILVVDDDDMTIMCLKNFCKGKDIEIDVAGGGNEAVEKSKASTFNMTIIDFNLDKDNMKGDAVLKKIKAAGGSVGKAVLMSGEDKSGDFASLGFDAFVSKPIKKGDFEGLVSGI